MSGSGSSGPEKAKQSSVSCAMTRSLTVAGATGTACLSSRSAIASISLRSTTGTRACGNALSEATATMCGSSGWISGLPLAMRWISSLGKASRLKPSTSTRSTGDILPTSAGRSHSGCSRSSCRMAQRLADEMITSVAPAARWKKLILAGLVEVEAVMGVLERGHADAARDQARNELLDQRGFARPAPAGETDNAHVPLIAPYSKTPGREAGRFLIGV